VAALSGVYLITSSQAADAKAGNFLNDFMANAVAKVRCPELDPLGAEFGNDMHAFATFQDSAVAKALISVYVFVTKELQEDPVVRGAAVSAAVHRSIKQRTPEWKAAYEAGQTTQPAAAK
jgi:hypothetical protein